MADRGIDQMIARVGRPARKSPLTKYMVYTK